MRTALLRFCNLFVAFFLVVGSLGERSRLVNSRLLRLFTAFVGISSVAAALLSFPTLFFFLDEDDKDDEDKNESDGFFFIPSTLFSFFSRDFVVGVGLNFIVGSLIFEPLIFNDGCWRRRVEYSEYFQA